MKAFLLNNERIQTKIALLFVQQTTHTPDSGPERFVSKWLTPSRLMIQKTFKYFDKMSILEENVSF